MERTYIMVKPDGVQRGLIGDIIKRFEQKGFKLVAMKFMLVHSIKYYSIIIRVNLCTICSIQATAHFSARFIFHKALSRDSWYKESVHKCKCRTNLRNLAVRSYINPGLWTVDWTMDRFHTQRLHSSCLSHHLFKVAA